MCGVKERLRVMQEVENFLVPIKGKKAVSLPVSLDSNIQKHIKNLITSNPYLSEDDMRLIQGHYKWHKKSQYTGEVDKIIIESLLRTGINKKLIEYIFMIYPTSGVYASRQNPGAYIETIIHSKMRRIELNEEELRNPLFASKSISKEKEIVKLNLYQFQIHLCRQHHVRQGTETNQRYLFNGKTYDPINDDKLNELCQRVLGKYRYLFTSSAISKIRGYLGGDEEAKINEAANVNLIALNNVIVDAAALNEQQFSPNQFVRNIHPFDFDQSATCPTFHQFLDEAFMGNKATIQLLKEIIGYTLYKGMPISTLFLLVGPDRISKSILLLVLTALHGAENVANIRLAKLAQGKSHGELFGKTVNIVNEYSFPQNMQIDTIIKVTTGDSVTGRTPGEKPITFKPYAKHFVATNEIPDFGDNSYEMMRRTYQIRFPKAFRPEDEDLSLANKLIEELPGIFNWAIEGLQQLQQRDRPFTFSYTDAMVSDMKATYYEGNETVAFLESYLEKTDNYNDHEPYKKTNDSYKEFMAQQQQKPLGKKKFRQIVESMGFVVIEGSQNNNVIRFAKLKS
jgi:P4 family phage/plasmid primase-like protien